MIPSPAPPARGVVAGRGIYPMALCERLSAAGLRPVVACLEGQADPSRFPSAAGVGVFPLGALPAAADVISAELSYDCYDCDHPGEEGTVSIGGGTPISIPADPGWGDAWANGITLGVPAGAFGGGTNAVFSFSGRDCVNYEVRNVRLSVVARLDACP